MPYKLGTIMLSFWVIFGWTTAGGCIGGLLYLISSLMPQMTPSARGADALKAEQAPKALALNRATFWFWIGNALIGAGGSWATMLAAIWAKRAPFGNNLEDHLSLIATAIIGGYAGSKILPAVADRLTRELLDKAVKESKASAASAADSKDQAQDAQRETEAAKHKAELAGKAAEVNAYLSSDRRNPADSLRYIGTLTAAVQEMPTLRPAVWALAWLYSDVEDDDGAVKTLENFIAAKQNAGEGKTKDVADAYWNIAYYELNRKHVSAANREAAKAALAESVKIQPDYQQAIEQDPDLSALMHPQAAKPAHAATRHA